MQIKGKLSILVLALADFIQVAVSSTGKLTNVIQTDKGPVRGEIVKTLQNSSFEYSAFRAIPYAKPPIGQLRFHPPVEVDPWTNILKATSESQHCPQIDVHGIHFHNEDCLYLNVYSPRTSFETIDDNLLAVMVFIHGGTFLNGDIRSSLLGPDFLITDNVIIVDMNYRLGAFGFLSLDIDGVTGNMGLKDQLLALKWIQRNIKKFGGDPKKVTLFGQSAGASSVMLHHLSPASEGLFRNIIAMSGTPLSPWAFMSKNQLKQSAFDLGKKLGIDGVNEKKLFEKLQDTSAEKIVNITHQLKSLIGLPPFMPTTEDPKKAKDVFLTWCPMEFYKPGNYTEMPVIMGFAESETLSYAAPFTNVLSKIKEATKPLTSLVGKLFPFDIIFKGIENIARFIIDLGIMVTTDVLFIAPIDSTQQYLATSSQPVYYYRNSFDYNASRHKIVNGVNLPGTGHTDDLLQIFWQADEKQSLDPESDIGKQRTKMVRLWTNFAKYENPTPNGTADPLLNVTWIPSGSKGLHLEIGQDELKMGPRATDFIVTISQLLSKLNPFDCS